MIFRDPDIIRLIMPLGPALQEGSRTRAVKGCPMKVTFSSALPLNYAHLVPAHMYISFSERVKIRFRAASSGQAFQTNFICIL